MRRVLMLVTVAMMVAMMMAVMAGPAVAVCTTPGQCNRGDFGTALTHATQSPAGEHAEQGLTNAALHQ